MVVANGDRDKLAALERLGFERSQTARVESETLRFGLNKWRTKSWLPAMGTRVSVTALGASPARTEEATGRAIEEMARLIALLSRYEPGSALTCLNDAGTLRHPPLELRRVVVSSALYHTMSRGAFDVTVAPIVDLYRASGGTIPSEAATREALQLVGPRHITMSGHELRFERSGMWITLDGIAKGFIVDAMAGELQRHGIRDFLIDAGGDIRTSGTNQAGDAWRIAVRDPAGAGITGDTIPASNAAIATSGGYENYFGVDTHLHHIVNGTTGTSPHRAASVTIMAPTAMAADALATAAFVMEPSGAVDLIESIPGCACLVIDSEGHHLPSHGWHTEVQSS